MKVQETRGYEDGDDVEVLIGKEWNSAVVVSSFAWTTASGSCICHRSYKLKLCQGLNGDFLAGENSLRRLKRGRASIAG